MTRSRVLAVLVLVITIMIVVYPEVSFRASLEGLELWFEIVLPTLLPFFILADLLMGLGIVHFLGSLLEPLMRPLFRLPGVGGFALAMGLVAGYPMGAKITGELAREGQITQVEVERLAGFAHTAGPLFLVGAVAVGMFQRPELGISLAIAHYAGALLVGFCMRLHKGAESPSKKGEGSYLGRALRSLDQARKRDGRSLGQLFADAVRGTFQSMLLIGGCIMLFSVLVQVLAATGIFGPLQTLLGVLLRLVGIDPNLAGAVLSGFFETTLGARTAAQAPAALGAQASVASLVLGWSGLSVQIQAAAMLTGAKLRLKPYLYARLLHGMFAAMLTALLLGPASFIPASLTRTLPAVSPAHYLNGSFAVRFLASARLATSFLLILVIILSAIWLLKRMIYISFRSRS
ncbi:MAG: sporulation integral membrane protein YlbJ [Bacillota bacterium]|jgi:sporulation integral membrane protein YlbJ|nr:sporulation integral membrane protein YlbJ [Bacillota bacterium]HHT91098.1 sporulation integral membrane protein YlbJ [Bacillota bacterium]